MRDTTLAELAQRRFQSFSYEELMQDIAFLRENLSGEQIFFSINYLAKIHRQETEECGLIDTLNEFKDEIQTHYELALTKRSQATHERGNSTDDNKNAYQGKDTPSWFRKSFDSNLFK
jgi:hypothetical protein